ncbi:MAG: hypothetical protein V3V16_11815 [Melioribacteraceae bacterium]
MLKIIYRNNNLTISFIYSFISAHSIESKPVTVLKKSNDYNNIELEEMPRRKKLDTNNIISTNERLELLIALKKVFVKKKN